MGSEHGGRDDPSHPSIRRCRPDVRPVLDRYRSRAPGDRDLDALAMRMALRPFC